MPIEFWCVFIAILMPYVPLYWVKGEKSYDNAQPRAYYQSLQGVQARAMACHQNHNEALVYFAAAVLSSQILHAPHAITAPLCIAFIVFRVLYTACYIANKPTLRSLIWVGGFFSAVGVMLSVALV